VRVATTGEPTGRRTGGRLDELYLQALKKYATFTGRARRRSSGSLRWSMSWSSWRWPSWTCSGQFQRAARDRLLSGLYMLAVLVPGIAVTVRRLHDTDERLVGPARLHTDHRRAGAAVFELLDSQRVPNGSVESEGRGDRCRKGLGSPSRDRSSHQVAASAARQPRKYGQGDPGAPSVGAGPRLAPRRAAIATVAVCSSLASRPGAASRARTWNGQSPAAVRSTCQPADSGQ